MSAMSSVLVLQHVGVEDPGRVPRELGDAGALVVMGGPMGVYEVDRHPHLADEIHLIRRAIAADVPVLGVCLGSQLIAAALGAEVRPSGRQEIGWLPVTLREGATTDPLFAGAPSTFAPLHWHGDVFALPPGATPLASSAMTEHQAFRAGARTWGLLFHLEADAAKVAAMAAAFGDDLAAAGIDAAAVVAASPAASAAIEALATTVFGRFAAMIQ
jgi:GMP synthase (glutamine-hydrolysing)